MEGPRNGKPPAVDIFMTLPVVGVGGGWGRGRERDDEGGGGSHPFSSLGRRSYPSSFILSLSLFFLPLSISISLSPLFFNTFLLLPLSSVFLALSNSSSNWRARREVLPI